MRTLPSLALLAALSVVAQPALVGPTRAQPAVDPDWPCVQRKVAELSIGQMWAAAPHVPPGEAVFFRCLLYTSDAADD